MSAGKQEERQLTVKREREGRRRRGRRGRGATHALMSRESMNSLMT